MAGKPLARAGDVSATVGTTFYTGADSGSWAAGTVSETTTPGFTSDGTVVVTQASCVFTFTGKAGTAQNPGSSTVTLSAGDRALQIGDAAPLVDGDRQADDFGNTLRVASTAVWSSS